MIPGMISKRQQKKLNKKVINQSVWNSKTEFCNNHIKVIFIIGLSGHSFMLDVHKLMTLANIIPEINEYLKHNIDLPKSSIYYKLLYDSSNIDIDMIISLYYDEKIPIQIIFTHHYFIRDDIYDKYLVKNCCESIYDYNLDGENVKMCNITNIQLYQVDKSISGVVCKEYVIKKECRTLNDHCLDKFFKFELKEECCNFFEGELNILCRKCLHHLDYLLSFFRKIFTYDILSYNKLIKDTISEAFVNRFRNLIAFYTLTSPVLEIVKLNRNTIVIVFRE
jgi:hypothetical protein